jgi:hypothetical protein
MKWYRLNAKIEALDYDVERAAEEELAKVLIADFSRGSLLLTVFYFCRRSIVMSFSFSDATSE